MNENWKFLIAHRGKLELGLNFFLAQSCLTAILLGSVLYAASVAAGKTAHLSADAVFFPQEKIPASMDDAYKTMLALAGGRLVLKNGCLRLKPGYIKESLLLIWPGRYEFKVKNQTITIKDLYLGVEPEVRIKLNSEVIVVGGGAPDGYVPDAATLVHPLPKGCKGPYWMVGGIELAPKGKKR